jgi:hypothetical protein
MKNIQSFVQKLKETVPLFWFLDKLLEWKYR